MEEAVRQRIIEVFNKKNTNPTKFSKGDSVLQNRLSRQLRGAVITFDTIQRILEEFPDISAEWLIRGVGEMFLQKEGTPTKFDAEVEVCNGVITIKKKQVWIKKD